MVMRPAGMILVFVADISLTHGQITLMSRAAKRSRPGYLRGGQ
jgi:hypothetical protein